VGQFRRACCNSRNIAEDDRPHLRNDPNKRGKKEERHDQSQHQQDSISHEYEELASRLQPLGSARAASAPQRERETQSWMTIMMLTVALVQIN
jgi:hypothetical protein